MHAGTDLLATCAAKPAGFVDNAEILNSRAAMIGFFGVIIVEAASRPAAPALSARRRPGGVR